MAEGTIIAAVFGALAILIIIAAVLFYLCVPCNGGDDGRSGGSSTDAALGGGKPILVTVAPAGGGVCIAGVAGVAASEVSSTPGVLMMRRVDGACSRWAVLPSS